MGNIKHKILPPTYFYSFIGLSIILHFIIPIKQVIFPPWSYLGILPISHAIRQFLLMLVGVGTIILVLQFHP